ncbi:MAG: hypothetical protein RLZZ175_68 [Bacteroidota bacterium]|jgi:type IX secretion system PorP/SprF family membrane protein
MFGYICIMLRKIICIVLILIAYLAQAQLSNNAQLLDFYTLQNPAFVGTIKYSRIGLAQRNQWIGVGKGGYNTTVLQGDHYAKRYTTGLGGFLVYDKNPSGFANTNIALQASHVVQVTDKSALRVGLQFLYGLNTWTNSNYVFGDQLSPDGQTRNTSIDNVSETKSYFSITPGLMWYGEKWWVHTAIHDINHPNKSSINGNNLPMFWIVGVGAKMYVGRAQGLQRELRSTFTTGFNMSRLVNAYQFDYSGVFNFHPLLLGFGFRGLPYFKYDKLQQDAIRLTAGLKQEFWQFNYWYDVPIGNLGFSTYGAHEIGLLFTFGDHGGIMPKWFRKVNTHTPILY